MNIHRAERKLWGLSLILAPALFATSTFFWLHTSGRIEYGAAGGTLIVMASVFWIPAFIGPFDRLKHSMPSVATCTLMIAVYGCIGGVAFGLDGLFAEAFKISHEARREAWARHPAAFNLVLFWPGPLFPLSLLVFGAMLIRAKSIPLWSGILLCLAALAFPVSRIARVE